MNINMNDDAILLEVKIAPDTSYENIIDSMSLNNLVNRRGSSNTNQITLDKCSQLQ